MHKLYVEIFNHEVHLFWFKLFWNLNMITWSLPNVISVSILVEANSTLLEFAAPFLSPTFHDIKDSSFVSQSITKPLTWAITLSICYIFRITLSLCSLNFWELHFVVVVHTELIFTKLSGYLYHHGVFHYILSNNWQKLLSFFSLICFQDLHFCVIAAIFIQLNTLLLASPQALLFVRFWYVS